MTIWNTHDTPLWPHRGNEQLQHAMKAWAGAASKLSRVDFCQQYDPGSQVYLSGRKHKIRPISSVFFLEALIVGNPCPFRVPGRGNQEPGF
jgi:hypothetical protein